MSWKGKRVLITGAGGFIGSHLTERLVREGAVVKCLWHYRSYDDLSLYNEKQCEVLKNIEIVRGDLLDPYCVLNAVKKSEVIFHLGALISIPYSYVHPYHAVQVNVLGTLHVMTAAREIGVGRIIHTSTSEVYGTAKTVPINEEHPLQGQSPYSASKIGADKIAESFYRSYNLPVSILRPFNTYGPRQSARAIIPTIITQALYEKEIKLGSLHPTRDMTFVSDTVNGFICMAETERVVGDVVNVGTGYEVSIGNLVGQIQKIIGVQKEIVCDQERMRPKNSEVERLLCDNTKAKELLGWEPKVKLEDGLTKTIDWIQSHNFQYDSSKYLF